MKVFNLDELLEFLTDGKTMIYHDYQIKPTDDNIQKLTEMGKAMHSRQITDQMILDTVGERV